MGAHHFKLYFVPPGTTPTRDDEGDYEGNYLANFALTNSIVLRLRQIFKKSNHWGGVEEYVSDNKWGSDLRICRSEGGRIEDIVLRYAPVADLQEKLGEFVAIAKDAGCFLFQPTSGAVMAPDFAEVLHALHAHHAFKFISDPKGAIVDAAKKIDENK